MACKATYKGQSVPLVSSLACQPGGRQSTANLRILSYNRCVEAARKVVRYHYKLRVDYIGKGFHYSSSWKYMKSWFTSPPKGCTIVPQSEWHDADTPEFMYSEIGVDSLQEDEMAVCYRKCAVDNNCRYAATLDELSENEEAMVGESTKTNNEGSMVGTGSLEQLNDKEERVGIVLTTMLIGAGFTVVGATALICTWARQFYPWYVVGTDYNVYEHSCKDSAQIHSYEECIDAARQIVRSGFEVNVENVQYESEYDLPSNWRNKIPYGCSVIPKDMWESSNPDIIFTTSSSRMTLITGEFSICKIDSESSVAGDFDTLDDSLNSLYGYAVFASNIRVLILFLALVGVVASLFYGYEHARKFIHNTRDLLPTEEEV